jgi:hypothetical protein
MLIKTLCRNIAQIESEAERSLNKCFLSIYYFLLLIVSFSLLSCRMPRTTAAFFHPFEKCHALL